MAAARRGHWLSTLLIPSAPTRLLEEGAAACICFASALFTGKQRGKENVSLRSPWEGVMLQKGPGFGAHQLGASRYNLRWGVVLTGVVIEIWVGKEKPCKIAAAGEKSFEEPGEKKKKKRNP